MDGVARLECRRVDEFRRVEKLTLAQRGHTDPVVATQPHPSFTSLIASRIASPVATPLRASKSSGHGEKRLRNLAAGRRPGCAQPFLAGAASRTNALAAKILDRLEPVRHAADSRQAGKSSEQAGLN
jgi:hypothetical protein